MKLVSIIIPYYNNVDTIVESVNSALKQTHSRIEIIVVDDGSKIPLTDILPTEVKNNPHVKLLRQNNTGPSGARNLGAQSSNGSFFVFLDADDKLAPHYVSSCLATFEEKKNINIVYSEAAYFGKKKGKWELPVYKFENFLFCNCIPIFAMIRREHFFAVCMFDVHLRYNEDWDLWLRMIAKFGGVYRIPKVLYFYRKRHAGNSLTDMNDETQNKIAEKNHLYIFYKNFEIYEKAGINLFQRIMYAPDFREKYLSLRKKYYGIWYKKIFYALKRRKPWMSDIEQFQ
ncbi:glycosyltransferase family A protein [Niabella sp.]|uniref:glycosyltransferase family 2 protein n=1 Tax=Niabella sp. TaxID=1962976 RepID=UPI0026227CB6|nr:glycosyltransferase family A protein [Niabella sp.]